MGQMVYMMFLIKSATSLRSVLDFAISDGCSLQFTSTPYNSVARRVNADKGGDELWLVLHIITIPLPIIWMASILE